MSRESFLTLLSSYRPASQAEEQAQIQIANFACSQPDCFKRELLTGHITGSAWVLNPAKDKALLTLHKKLGLWLQPGGHADGSPDIAGVALREAEEESGISGLKFLLHGIFDLDIHEIPEYRGLPAHLHYDVRFLLHAPEHDRFKVSSESHELCWLSAREIDYVKTDESVRRLRDKWLTYMQLIEAA